MYQKKKTTEQTLLLLCNIISIILSYIAAVWLRYGTFDWIKAYGNQSRQLMIIVLLYALVTVFWTQNERSFPREGLDEFTNILREELVFYVLLMMVHYLTHDAESLSRMLSVYLLLANTCISFLLRTLLKRYMLSVYRNGKFSSRMLVVTEEKRAEELIEQIQSKTDWEYTIIGIALADRTVTSETQLGGIPVLAGSATLLEYLKRNEVDEIYFSCSDIKGSETLRTAISKIQEMGIQIDLDLDAMGLPRSGVKQMNEVGSRQVLSLSRNVISTGGLAAKRAMDIVGSLVGLVLLGVLSIIIVPCIHLDSKGPAIFRQTRIGKNGRRFTLYKFRSMCVDAEGQKKELQQYNEIEGLMFKMEDDPRVTKVGRFLRKTSLDELPQFWNVLKGDMSLVGTRPPTEDEFKYYTSAYKARLSMTPGLTGLWQISGRSDIKNFDEVVKLDMEYIDNWSLALDFSILIKTIGVVFTGKGSE